MKYNSLYRIFIIVKMFIKFVLQLYIFNKRHKTWDSPTQEKWEKLLQKQAIEYRKVALKLEGLMIKVGQFLSTRADIMPEIFLKELADLIDQVPPVSSDISLGILEEEWGQDIYNYLEWVSDKPVASASIGEVFQARMRNGQEVAIKIQRHRVASIVQTDFKALRIVLFITDKFTKFGKEIDTKALYREVVSIVGDELDYTKERKNAQSFQQRFSGTDAYYIPQFYEEYCTSKVLVMEWIEGRKVTDISFMKQHGIDRKKTAASVFQFFIDQLLDQGAFHADPHQGNILIKADGTIVILDFGMIGYISRGDSAKIRRMLQGFVLDDYKLVIDQLQELGFLLPNANKYKLEQILRESVDLYLSQDISTMDQKLVEEIFEDLQALVREQPIQLPVEFAFLGRAASIGLGVLTIIDPDIDFIELGKPVVLEWLDEADNSEEDIRLQVLKDSVKPLLSLPRNMNEYLESPKSALRSEERRQFHSFSNQRYLLILTFSGLFTGLSLFMLFISILLAQETLIYGSTGLTVVSISTLFVFLIRHHKWISKNRPH
ncbi:AarF/ABC1/UbiB kinase family protein [Paenalkalicoccus suaedae]|uniref:AarF/ABC1/UbiB kinase family protein n=1 Tax=Paenalkalicoccus suaedae TaxID=2592382 RepID=A0A859FD14_9BACI|nr:AarF/UbiB family protein [Paenalkalicoccus suaedae]QKS70701.1 AarF/ABC1/UbiB kinase family protein [Paenalkalicoccus suaedae]